jgi:tRNA wybutosine-synthesizing protein 2
VLKDSLDWMKFKEKLQNSLKGTIPQDLLKELPAGYAVIGNIGIFRHLSLNLKEYKREIGESLISIDPQVETVVEQIDTITSYRKPVIEHIAGVEKTQTIHKEFNTIFHIDLSSITFSPGNKNERNHLIQTVKENEIICDMFACIGNLSLPIAVNKPSAQVYGIEWNQNAYDFLRKNIEVNRVGERYFPIFGDNNENTPKNIATRVLMGYFNCSYQQLVCALDAINDEGWIHLHRIIQRDEIEQPVEIIEQAKMEMGYEIELKNNRIIKKYSPRMNHVCSDIFVNK